MKTPKDMIPGTIHKTNNYGDLKIVEYKGCCDVKVEFLTTGFTLSARSEHVRSGDIKDPVLPTICGVGFIGNGKHSASKSKGKTRSYSAWHEMIRRCYSDKSKAKYPTYHDCTVCDEWHNFQNFAEWFEENHPSDGFRYDLDKDIKVDGNRLYSPETCVFTCHQRNAEKASAKNYKFNSPDGVVVEIYNLTKFCRENNLHQGAMSAVHGGKLAIHKNWTKF